MLRLYVDCLLKHNTASEWLQVVSTPPRRRTEQVAAEMAEWSRNWNAVSGAATQ